MEGPSHSTEVQRHHGKAAWRGGFAALVLLSSLPLAGWAARVPVRDGQAVNLKLRNILTTDNVQKNDLIEFEVTQDILVNGHIVIAKGAVARGKILEVKGAYKPRAKDAEVIFEFTMVTSVDKQELRLRRMPEKPRKGKEKANDIHERSEVPGQIARVVGADKGKEYEAYIDGSFTVTTSDVIVVAPAAAPTGGTETPPPVTTSTPISAPPPTPAVSDVGAETSSVEFDSTPDGADIIIDGVTVGSTHSRLRLTPGRHTIEIHMAGYRTWSRVMIVDPDSHPSVRATLVPQ